MLRMMGCAALMVLLPAIALAHCDTMDGPVVVEARLALEKGDVTPLLKWVTPEAEPEIRAAFEQTRQVRALGPQARELADMYFLETLVRVHRAGEGAPYTGLKPAGTEIDHAVAAADQALVSGSDAALIKMLTDAARNELHKRFVRAQETRKHAADSVAAGREYVEAYVTYVHYVEALHQAIIGRATAHDGEPAAGHAH